jgi:poly-beta-1,6-N-acetyl-D-glucosamine synthase
MLTANTRYTIVSPVKDEEDKIEVTIRSVLNQTILPIHWIIVDDGSSDHTARIVEQYVQKYSWIRLLRLSNSSGRHLGWAEIRAFGAGYELVKDEAYDFIVKLDGDLELPSDYFARLLQKFWQDKKLGIASGECMEREGETWRPSSGPSYHAVGASKIVRRQCFEEIGGFVYHRGWDTVDEIRAQVKGWKTAHFEDIPFYHLRREGAANGPISTAILHGEVYYWTGGGFLFLLLKLFHRSAIDRPLLLVGLAMFWGYLRLWFTRQERIVSIEEAKHYRRLLNARIWDEIRAICRLNDENPRLVA